MRLWSEVFSTTVQPFRALGIPMGRKLDNMQRQVIYALLMVLFIMLVERLRRAQKEPAQPWPAGQDVKVQPERPPTGDIDF